jgi:hypothetical protein
MGKSQICPEFSCVNTFYYPSHKFNHFVAADAVRPPTALYCGLADTQREEHTDQEALLGVKWKRNVKLGWQERRQLPCG